MEKNMYQIIVYGQNNVLISQHRFNTIDDINGVYENFPIESFKETLKKDTVYVYIYPVNAKYMIILDEKNKHLFEIEMDGEDSKLGNEIRKIHKECIRREKISHLMKNI